MLRPALVACLCLSLFTGCATTGETVRFRETKSPAWSLEDTNGGLVVAVSPARQGMQLAGLSAAVVGAGFSAIVNAKHRRAVEAALEGYDAGAVFAEHLTGRLAETMGADLARVEPLTGYAGYRNAAEAERERFSVLGRNGHGQVLDVKMTYGIFGYEGTLVAKLDASLRSVPGGQEVWGDTLIASSEDVLATDPLADPTKRMGGGFFSPRFTVEEGAIAQWTGDGGATLRQRMEAAVQGATSALLVSLGLADEAQGNHVLGVEAMRRKDFKVAHDHFQKALALQPDVVTTRNAMAVNLAHNGQLEEALRITEALAASHPEYGPAHYNLAWWYAVEAGDVGKARASYERALALGMPAEKKVEKALGR